MVKVENLTKSFGFVKAVDNLSFEIQQGEVIGFLGPNGAGKTTTMRMITGYLSPDSGMVYIADVPVGENTINVQRRIGYLPENNPLYNDMLIAELLEFSADLKGISRKERKSAFDFVVSAVGIGDVFYSPIRELSKGYKQRLGIATALLHKPDILIMDEPTEGLDPNQRTEIRSLIKTLAKDRTIIMSTHVMQEASAVCNRMLIINKGRLIADGTAEELSHAAKDDHTIILEVEGDGVESALRNLTGIEDISIENVNDQRVLAKIATKRTLELQPEISRLAHEYRWIIWRLTEEEYKLEDIFRKLTSEE